MIKFLVLSNGRKQIETFLKKVFIREKNDGIQSNWKKIKIWPIFWKLELLWIVVFTNMANAKKIWHIWI